MADDKAMATWKKIGIIAGALVSLIALFGLIGAMMTKDNSHRLDVLEPAVEAKVDKEIHTLELNHMKETQAKQTHLLEKQSDAMRRLEVRLGTYRPDNYENPD